MCLSIARHGKARPNSRHPASIPPVSIEEIGYCCYNPIPMSKYIFVTGGVCSGLGKGVASASIGSLLENRGFSIRMIKIDPYINVDAGTMSPYQHGEVYVTDDGAETDLDLGNYSRFTSSPIGRDNSITTGQVYQAVITKEREGRFLGRTVQVIPHITDEIKARIIRVGEQPGVDVTLVEVGGTVGDIESIPFLEAARQFIHDLGKENVLFVHLTLVPQVYWGEPKSKPTQHSVRELREIGIQPDLLLCRSSRHAGRGPPPQDLAVHERGEGSGDLRLRRSHHDLRHPAGIRRTRRWMRSSSRSSGSRSEGRRATGGSRWSTISQTPSGRPA